MTLNNQRTDTPGRASLERGAVDEFCLFSRALKTDEIRALYSAGKPQPDSVAELKTN